MKSYDREIGRIRLSKKGRTVLWIVYRRYEAKLFRTLVTDESI